MTVYYIDGYNLMFRALRAGDDLQRQREAIIKDLQGKIHLLQLDAVLVFDAQYQYGGTEKTHLKQLEIVFTAEGETADEYILRKLKSASHPEKCVVVTSDKRLAWAARRRSAKTESVEEFLSWINKRCLNKIRRLKKAEPNPNPLKAPSIPRSLSISKEITPGDTIEERFAYYLKVFEEDLPPSLKEEIKQQRHLTDMERWLKAFESPDEE